MEELEAVQELRLKLRAAQHLIRDLNRAAARAEAALEEARQAHNAQPKEAQRDYDRNDRDTAELCVA